MEFYWLKPLLFLSNAIASPVLIDEMTASVDRQVFTLSELCLDIELRAALNGANDREISQYTKEEMETARDTLVVEYLLSEKARASGIISVSEGEVTADVAKIESRVGKSYRHDIVSAWVRKHLFFRKASGSKKTSLVELSEAHDIKKFDMDMTRIRDSLALSKS